MATTNQNYLYAKYIKTATDQFNNEKATFIVLKNKGFEHSKLIFNDKWLNLKSRHFKHINLEKGKVYALAVNEMGEYMNHDYIKTLMVQVVNESKANSLLKKFDVQQETIVANMVLSESEESDSEEEILLVPVPLPTRKKTKRRKRKD